LSWQAVLKMPKVQSNKTMIAYNLVNRAQFQKYLQQVKDAVASGDADTEGGLETIKNTLRQVGTGQLPLEKFVETWKNTGHMDLSMDEIQRNLTELMESLTFLPKVEIEKLLDQAVQLKNEGKHDEVVKILEKIDRFGSLGVSTLKKNKKIAAKLKYLRLDTQKSYIYFTQTPPSNAEMKKLAENLGGKSNTNAARVDGDVILLNIKTLTDFRLLVQPKTKRDKENKVEILDNDDAVKEKAVALQLYNKFKDKNGLMLNIDSKVVEIDPKVIEAVTLSAKNVKYELVEPFGASSIINYMRIIDRVAGVVTSFKPVRFKEILEDKSRIVKLPKLLFLEKGSKKSFNFNPYAEIIMKNVFQKQNWADVFFDQIRTQGSLSEKQAKTLIVEDITRTLPDTGKRESEDYNVPLRIFRSSIENINLPFDKLRRKVYKVLTDSERADAIVTDKVEIVRNETYQFLKNSYTVKEAEAIKKYLLEQGYEEDEVRVDYFFRSSPAKYEAEERDNDGNIVRNPDGSPKIKEYDGKDRADSAKIFTFEEEDDEGNEVNDFMPFTFKDAKENEGIQVETGTTEMIEERIKDELERAKKLLSQVEGKPKERKLSTAKPKEGGRAKVIQSEKKLKQKIEELEAKLKEGLSGDIKESTQKLRNQINSKGNFPAFLIDFAKENNLIDHVKTYNRDKGALDVISAERSLIFLGVIASIRGDEVKKSYKIIDSNIQENPDKAMKEAEKLNDNMASILNRARDDIVEGFKQTVQKLIENPEQFKDTMVKEVLDKLSSASPPIIRRVTT